MSSVIPGSMLARPQAAWRWALPALLAAALLLLGLYRETGLAMVTIWERSGTFTHAFVVPPISLWLIWRQRAALAQLTPRPQPWMLLPLGLSALAWLLGDLGAVNALTQLALVAMLVLLVPVLLGLQVTRQLLFPLGFLFFCVPLGEFMMPLLMEGTADFTVAALRLSGIPVFREGLQFVIPSGNWSVVEACSGIRYLIASVMVGTLFAYLNYHSTRRRLIFVLVAMLVPLVANWLRAYMIVMLGHLSGNRLAVGVDHLIYGWVFFGVVMLAMFMIGARWAEPELATPVAAGSDATGGAAGGAQRWLPALLLSVLVLLGPQLALQGLSLGAPAAAPRLSPPTLQARGWQTMSEALTDWTPAFESPAAQVLAGYEKDGHEVGLYLAYYAHQNYQSKLINSQNMLVRSDDPIWSQVEVGEQDFELAGRPLSLRSAALRSDALLRGGHRRLTAWQFFWVDGQLTSSDLRAKAYGVRQRLLGRGDAGAAVVVFAEKGEEAAMRSFLQDNWPALEAQLRGLQQGRRP